MRSFNSFMLRCPNLSLNVPGDFPAHQDIMTTKETVSEESTPACLSETQRNINAAEAVTSAVVTGDSETDFSERMKDCDLVLSYKEKDEIKTVKIEFSKFADSRGTFAANAKLKKDVTYTVCLKSREKNVPHFNICQENKAVLNYTDINEKLIRSLEFANTENSLKEPGIFDDRLHLHTDFLSDYIFHIFEVTKQNGRIELTISADIVLHSLLNSLSEFRVRMSPEMASCLALITEGIKI